MHLFYTPSIEAHHHSFLLNEEESKHAIRVLRLQEGDIVHLIDGRGGLYKTEIIDPHPKRTSLRILEVTQEFGKVNYELHLAVGPTKNIDRIEWLIEKATEIGIHEVTPIICARSERKDVKVERLEKIAIAAAKQSLKAYVPEINEATSFVKFLNNIAEQSYVKGIAHCIDAEKKYINNTFSPGQKYLILIGPEGDFSEQEIEMALSAGFIPLSLGEARLRTETAALAAVLEVSILNR